MTAMFLSKRGYGTYKEMQDLDTDDFLDLLEYEQICQAIEQFEIEEAKRN